MQHRYMKMTSWLTSSKNAIYGQTFNKSYSKGKNMTLQVNC